MKRIGYVTIQGVPWPIYRASMREMPSEDLEGACEYDRARILVRDDVDPRRYPELITHETLHALLYVSGVETMVDERVPEKQREAFNEQMVKLLTSVFLGAIPDLAKLTKVRRARGV